MGDKQAEEMKISKRVDVPCSCQQQQQHQQQQEYGQGGRGEFTHCE
jgi:hypothetical protein